MQKNAILTKNLKIRFFAAINKITLKIKCMKVFRKARVFIKKILIKHVNCYYSIFQFDSQRFIVKRDSIHCDSYAVLLIFSKICYFFM